MSHLRLSTRLLVIADSNTPLVQIQLSRPRYSRPTASSQLATFYDFDPRNQHQNLHSEHLRRQPKQLLAAAAKPRPTALGRHPITTDPHRVAPTAAPSLSTDGDNQAGGCTGHSIDSSEQLLLASAVGPFPSIAQQERQPSLFNQLHQHQHLHHEDPWGRPKQEGMRAGLSSSSSGLQ